jgi:hypothetical protein
MAPRGKVGAGRVHADLRAGLLGAVKMPDAVDRFVADLRASELAECAQDIEHALAVLDEEACINADAAGLFQVVYFVVGHPHHTLAEKLDMCHKMINLKGRQVGTPRELTGWH